MNNTIEHLKARFLKVYGNLPLNERDEVILNFNSEPLTWRAAYFEVSAGSDNAAEILKQLEKLEFI